MKLFSYFNKKSSNKTIPESQRSMRSEEIQSLNFQLKDLINENDIFNAEIKYFTKCLNEYKQERVKIEDCLRNNPQFKNKIIHKSLISIQKQEKKHYNGILNYYYISIQSLNKQIDLFNEKYENNYVLNDKENTRFILYNKYSEKDSITMYLHVLVDFLKDPKNYSEAFKEHYDLKDIYTTDLMDEGLAEFRQNIADNSKKLNEFENSLRKNKEKLEMIKKEIREIKSNPATEKRDSIYSRNSINYPNTLASSFRVNFNTRESTPIHLKILTNENNKEPKNDAYFNDKNKKILKLRKKLRKINNLKFELKENDEIILEENSVNEVKLRCLEEEFDNRNDILSVLQRKLNQITESDS